jgi:hypothetical protein
MRESASSHLSSHLKGAPTLQHLFASVPPPLFIVYLLIVQ